MEAAGKQMDAAQKSGDAKAQGEALGKIIGAAISGGDEVEALAPDMSEAICPRYARRTQAHRFLGRTQRRDGHAGVRSARDVFGWRQPLAASSKSPTRVRPRAFLALAGFAAVQADKETDHGYEKTYKQNAAALCTSNGTLQTKYGEYGMILGDRFAVKLSGNADSIDQLKAAVAVDQSRRARSVEGCRRQERLTCNGTRNRRGAIRAFCLPPLPNGSLPSAKALLRRRLHTRGERLGFDRFGDDVDLHFVG